MPGLPTDERRWHTSHFSHFSQFTRRNQYGAAKSPGMSEIYGIGTVYQPDGRFLEHDVV